MKFDLNILRIDSIRICLGKGGACLFALTLTCFFSSCRHNDSVVDQSSTYLPAATNIEVPELDSSVEQISHTAIRPISLSSEIPTDFRDLSLQDAVQIALTNSKVFRDLGGVVLNSPSSTRTTMDTAVLETDPRFGPQAALSAFDATFAASMFYENNDRALNNQFFGGGTRLLKQDAVVYQAQISKRTPYGTEFTIRNNIDYDANNAPGNLFPAAWDFNVEAEFRQSLLRGRGIDHGRIVGTSQVPGVYNGVLIARANTDISVADFEISVRDFVDSVEETYWDLYFAYRDLDSKITARDTALRIWRHVQALASQGKLGGAEEAEVRAQYYRFKEDVENALTGRDGGDSEVDRGLYVAERRLRYLIGLPSTDQTLLRPSEEPTRAEVVFDWDLSLEESLMKRAELRRQRWMVKRRELELVGSRNFLLPDLDVVALHRWRGFGRSFADNDAGRFSDSLSNFASGDFQESQVGVELAFPIGNRQAHAAVRNAEFLLARDRSLLEEQERRVVHDLSNAFAEVDRAYHVLQTVYNRREATRVRVEVQEVAYKLDKIPLHLLLDGQRRYAESESHYYRTLIKYNDSIRALHRQKGSLLEYSGIHLSEGPWTREAYVDGTERASRTTILEGEHLPAHRVISAGEEHHGYSP